MKRINDIYDAIYKENKLFGVDKKLKVNPFKLKGRRHNSVAVCGGVIGDEGKGRVTDELTARFLKRNKRAIHYRDNGGSNAGHTVEIGKIKLALHQLGSGVFIKNCMVVLGKGMVIHPIDLVEEIEQVKKISKGKVAADLVIDEMAGLCLDTHRAFEYAIRWSTKGYAASTGRGISQAYADVIYRHPLRMRDLARTNWKKPFTNHYQFYQKLIKGLGLEMKEIEVSRLGRESQKVGNLSTFILRLDQKRRKIKCFIKPCHQLISRAWAGKIPFVFEKAQGLGLNKDWGVYPDCTVSDCTYEGIRSSTEGIVDSNKIAIKAAVIKATYTSSVGSRVLPSHMYEKLAERIREDANEYGVTTGRPRDIHYLDLPLISYLMKIGQVEYLVPTHMDIVYPNKPVKVCVDYVKNGKSVDYRPDQEYLLGVKPKFIELPTWDKKELQGAEKPQDLPKQALQFLAFLKQTLGVEILMATVGPKRHQTIKWF